MLVVHEKEVCPSNCGLPGFRPLWTPKWAWGPFYIGAYGNIHYFKGAFEKDILLQNFNGPEILIFSYGTNKQFMLVPYQEDQPNK